MLSGLASCAAIRSEILKSTEARHLRHNSLPRPYGGFGVAAEASSCQQRSLCTFSDRFGRLGPQADPVLREDPEVVPAHIPKTEKRPFEEGGEAEAGPGPGRQGGMQPQSGEGQLGGLVGASSPKNLTCTAAVARFKSFGPS